VCRCFLDGDANSSRRPDHALCDNGIVGSGSGRRRHFCGPDGVYREVVPNARIAFSWAWHSTPERESQVTVSLQPDGGGTLLTLHHAQFFDEAARDGHGRGWNALLDKLENYLA